jgi:hypothetical protein
VSRAQGAIQTSAVKRNPTPNMITASHSAVNTVQCAVYTAQSGVQCSDVKVRHNMTTAPQGPESGGISQIDSISCICPAAPAINVTHWKKPNFFVKGFTLQIN